MGDDKVYEIHTLKEVTIKWVLAKLSRCYSQRYHRCTNNMFIHRAQEDSEDLGKLGKILLEALTCSETLHIKSILGKQSDPHKVQVKTNLLYLQRNETFRIAVR